MLSTKVVGNSGQAQHYFLGHDNYYTKEYSESSKLQEKDLAKERSEWWGRGAKELVLSGQIEASVFTQLLKGHLPNGEQLGLKVNGEIKHRPGFDLTFSAPKSVSILALIGEDQRILAAVNRATDKTLTFVERACAQARVTHGSVTTYENTHNLVVAKFLHDLSREADPQLHVHCVVMNMTQRANDKWRSLASQSGKYGADVTKEVNGFIERVRQHKKYFGVIFQSELAYEMKQLGYTPIKTGKDGTFEIQGISPKAIRAYSQRSQQIETYMKEHGFSSAKAAEVATLKTRKIKNNITRENLQALWKTRSEVCGIDVANEVKQVIQQALNAETIKINQEVFDLNLAKQAVTHAITQLSETRITLKEIEILNLASQYALGESVNIASLVQVIKDLQKEGELIALPLHSGQKQFITKTLLQYERDVLQMALTKHREDKPIISSQKVDSYLFAQTDLTAEQKQAIKTIFTSHSQINALEGASGTGKTHLIKPMMELAKLDGYQAILLTPSKVGSIDLQNQLRKTPKNLREWIKYLFDNSQYDTVSRFIKRHESLLSNTGSINKHRAIVFIDNATLISSKQMRDLVLINQKLGARLIPIGDKRSILGYQSGTPFTQMIEHGVTHASLTQNLRQQTNEIKTAISDTLQGNISLALEKINHRIFSIENKEERIATMAAHYASLDESQHAKAFVLMPSKTQCEEMNAAIREALKQQNVLPKQGMQTTALIPKSMSEVEYRYAKNYVVGQWVRFNENYASLKVRRGEYLKIADVKTGQNILTLENAKSQKVNWNPFKVGGSGCVGAIEIFDAKPRELSVGDILLWKRNLPQKKIYNGERFKIEAVRQNKLVLARDSGKRITVDLRNMEACHFEHGYAATTHQKDS